MISVEIDPALICKPSDRRDWEVIALAATLLSGRPKAPTRWVFDWFSRLRPLLIQGSDDAHSEDDDEAPLFERMRRGDGKGHPGDNRKQNKAFDKIVRDRNLSPEQARRVHDAISGRGYSRREIEEIADDMKSGG